MKISNDQDVLRNPLNVLLGSQAGVRLLRVLSHEIGEPLSAADAAKRCGLTAVGARKALAQLVQSGFVIRIGGGKAKQYKLRENEPLLSALRTLFHEEQVRYDSFLSRLREVFSGVPELRSAWIDNMPTKPGQAMETTVVTDVRAFPWIREELRARLSPVERRFEQVIETAVFTEADAPTRHPHALTLLSGTSLDDAPHGSVPRLHSDRDERTLRLSQGIAKLISTDPSIIKRALRHLDRLVQDQPGTATADLLEWRQILTAYSPERVREFLVSATSRAARLRQSSPFFAVLTPNERDVLLSDFEAKNEP